MQKLSLIYIALASLLLLGCADDIDVFRPDTNPDSDRISFRIQEADLWLPNPTRSTENSSVTPATTRSSDAQSTAAPSLPTPLNPEIIPLNSLSSPSSSSSPSGSPLYLHIYAIPTSAINPSLSSLSSLSSSEETRGAQKIDLGEGDKVGLIAIRYRADEDLDYSTATIIETYLVKNGDVWVPASDELRWKGNHKYDFYAYYPYEGNHKSFTISTKTTDKETKVTTYHAPVLTYTNQAKVADDCDLLVAKVSTSDDKHNSNPGAVYLNMTHPLSAIKFKTADGFKDCKIRGLDLSASDGFQSSATLDFDYYNTYLKTITSKDTQEDAKEDPTNIWETAEKAPTTNFSLDFHDASDTQSANNNLPQTDAFTNDQPIYVIPTAANLSCSPKVNLALELTSENGDSYILGAPSDGIDITNCIRPGFTTIYQISNSGDPITSESPYEFVAPKRVEISYIGGELPIDVKSVIKYGDLDIPVGWKAEVFEGMGYTKDGIEVITTSGGGLYNICQTVAKIGKQKSGTDISHLKALREAPRKGTETNPYDLSMRDGLRSTANCYIVNAAGHYKFPLVYGNAFTKGDKLGEACGIGASEFRNYIGHSMTENEEKTDNEKIEIDPHDKALEKDEKGNVIIPEMEARLIWHDATKLDGENLPYEGSEDSKIITVDPNLETGEDGYQYLKFEVSGSDDAIQQANAMIAVGFTTSTGGFKIVWSWHIWITDYDPYAEGNVIECQNSLDETPTVYRAFKYPLGYCDGPGTENYEGRTFKIKLTQDITGETAEVEIYQKPFYRAANNNVVMYQARRKDPFVATTAESKPNVRVYKEDTSVGGYIKKSYWATNYKLVIVGPGKVALKDGIQNPTKFYYDFKDADHDKSWYDNYKDDSKTDSKGDPAFLKLWNLGTADTPQKTIYDPCPPGFMVSPADFWEIWDSDENKKNAYAIEDQDLIEENRGIWMWSRGVTAHTNEVTGETEYVPAEGGSKFFLSANGRRKNGTVLDRVGRYCMYWHTNAKDDENGRFWADGKKQSNANGNWGNSGGASILPVAEP